MHRPPRACPPSHRRDRASSSANGCRRPAPRRRSWRRSADGSTGRRNTVRITTRCPPTLNASIAVTMRPRAAPRKGRPARVRPRGGNTSHTAIRYIPTPWSSLKRSSTSSGSYGRPSNPALQDQGAAPLSRHLYGSMSNKNPSMGSALPASHGPSILI